jgi:hypothetical protein
LCKKNDETEEKARAQQRAVEPLMNDRMTGREIKFGEDADYQFILVI